MPGYPEDMIIKPRLGFAGMGWVGRNWLKAVTDSGYADVLNLYDDSKVCLQEALMICSTAKATTSFDELLDDNNIDGIVISVSGDSGKQMAVKSLSNNKAVYCQKPIARRAKEVEKVIDMARKTNTLVGVDFSFRYIAAFQMISHMIRSGEIENIYGIELKFHNAHGPQEPWYEYNTTYGCMLNHGMTMIDLMLYALDFPEVSKVKSKMFYKGVRAKEKDPEDYAHVTMELANDSIATLSCSNNLHAGSDAVIEASFYGTNFGLVFKNINGSLRDFQAIRCTGNKSEVIAGPPDDWNSRAFIRWVRNLGANTGFNKEAECYLPSAKVIDKIYER